jgi:RNA polymerase sigma-70 factor (ECF subfamily)
MPFSPATAASTDDEPPRLPLPTSVTFTEVFLEHHATCLRLARRLVRDEVLAQDVVQEVFLAWWRTGGGAYRADRGALAAWLSTITHHKAVDAVRSSERHARLRSAAEAAGHTTPEERLVEDVVWWELGKERLREALPTLPLKQREVLSLVYLAGMTQAEVADRLGIPLGTVKSRTHAGLLRLKAAVSGSWTPSGPDAGEEDGRPRACAEVRSVPSAPWARAAATGGHDDVERCAAALVRAASTGADDGAAAAAMQSLSCALVEQHGADSLHALAVVLARLAATPRQSARAGR